MARGLPGNKIEFTALELAEGQDVDVFLIPRPLESAMRPSVVEFLDSLLSGPRCAPSCGDIEWRFREERDARDR